MGQNLSKSQQQNIPVVDPDDLKLLCEKAIPEWIQ